MAKLENNGKKKGETSVFYKTKSAMDALGAGINGGPGGGAPGGGLGAAPPALTRPKAAHLLNASNLRVFF